MKLGIVMDPIDRIKVSKDSSFAMLLAASARGHELYYMELSDLFLEGNIASARCRQLSVKDDMNDWFEFINTRTLPLSELDIVLMRKDPPVDFEFITASFILEHAQQQGTLVVNDPRALRDVNEKVYCTWFPELMSPTLVCNDMQRLREFVHQEHDVILKPLDAMGGESIFRVNPEDANLSVILETITRHEKRYVMAQRYIPEIKQGDKRILMIDGEPVSHALARIPRAGETRGNLAAGGTAEARPLTDRDREICARVAPTLQEKGLVFVGLDVIGDYLTEINVTSPTCIRELDSATGQDIAGNFINCLESKLGRV